MSHHLFSFPAANITVYGDSALDTYWYSSTNRISPEAPVPVAHYKNSEDRLSGAALIAAIIKNLSGKVTLTTCVGSLDCKGSDAEGGSEKELDKRFVRLLKSYDQDGNSLLAGLIETGSEITNNIRVVSQAQQLLKVMTNQPQQRFAAEVREKLNLSVNSTLSSCNTAVFYDAGLGVINSENLYQYLQNCRKQQIKTIYAPANQQAMLKFVNNKSLVDFIVVDHLLAAHHLDDLVQLSAHGVVVFDSSHGIKYLTKNNQANITISKNGSEIANNIGVLEVVTAVLALTLSIEGDIAEALALVNAAMNLASKEFGQMVVNIVELQLAYADHLLDNKYNYLKLAQDIKSARAKNKKIIFANGCFDVLHVGHITYLDAASKRGDKLFVAINSDCSIKRLKGPTRPINCLEDRVAALRAFHMIDWVVPFFTDTPEDFLRWLQPDVLVKGGDYDINGVVGREIVYSYGGTVDIIKHAHTEISSTKILESRT